MSKIKKHLNFHACPIKRDCEHNYYNDILITVMQEALTGYKTLVNYPSVAMSENGYYDKVIHEFLCECF